MCELNTKTKPQFLTCKYSLLFFFFFYHNTREHKLVEVTDRHDDDEPHDSNKFQGI